MSKPILILIAGSFGEAIVRRLEARGTRVISAQLAAFDDSVVAAEDRPLFVGIAAWRRYAAETDAVDASCWDHAIPSTEIVLEGTQLRAGPVVVPGRSACRRCFRSRWLSNSLVADRELALDAAYARAPNLGSEGFTPGMVEVGTAFLASDASAALDRAGKTRWFDFTTAGLSEEVLLRVHGCSRCGPSRRPGARYVDRLRSTMGDDE